jgi:release factor glutamine methyltransferase
MKVSIAEALLEASQFLRKAGVPESRREAGSLLTFVIHKDRTFLISHAEDQLTPTEFDSFREAVERRAEGEPLQYITGRQDFYGREFRVSPDVLIPRPETELLVEATLELMSDSETESRICDVGTGSGCIAITLLCERPKALGVALDLSPSALAIAKQNAIDKGVNGRIDFAISDCFDSLPPDAAPFDLIVSNPPYVAANVVGGLQREVRDYEPMIALTPGPDGLSIIRRLIAEAPGFLREDGYLLLEIGFDQGDSVLTLVDALQWRLVDIRPDLQGIPRIVILRKTVA